MTVSRAKLTPIDRALAKLAKAQKRLASEQGMVARRNARTEVLKALREYRRVLDRDYPIIAKKRKPRRKKARVRRGFTTMAGCPEVWLAWMASAKTPVQTIKCGVITKVYAPEWAIAICEKYHNRGAVTQLRRARRDRSFRETEHAAWLMKGQP